MILSGYLPKVLTLPPNSIALLFSNTRMSMVMPVFHTYKYMYPRYLAYPQKAGQEQDRAEQQQGRPGECMSAIHTYIHRYSTYFLRLMPIFRVE